MKLDCIRLGKPVENAVIERFTGRLRDDCLHAHVFRSLHDARQTIDVWPVDDNEQRPHGLLGDLPPTEFAQRQIDNRSQAVQNFSFSMAQFLGRAQGGPVYHSLWTGFTQDSRSSDLPAFTPVFTDRELPLD